MTDTSEDAAALEPVSSAAPQPVASEVAAAPPLAPDPLALPPVSPDDPCGPDLDLKGDTDFLNFVAATEEQLPASYYEFKRESIAFANAFAAIDKLLKRTLDVRLLALAAKLSLLNRDVASFARWVGSLAWALREHWQGVHLRAEGNDYSVRLGQLMALVQNSTVLLPVEYAPHRALPGIELPSNSTSLKRLCAPQRAE